MVPQRFPFPIFIIILISVLLLAVALLFPVAPARGADRGALSCPSNVAVFLEGSAQPGAALIAYFDGTAVGGGSAASNGAYRIPLRVKERPGIYPVEVRLRGSRVLVDRFECYVDVALNIQPTATPEIVVTVAPAAPAPTAQPTATVSANATTTATVGANASTTATTAANASTTATTAANASTTATTRVTTTPTVRATNVIIDNAVRIIEVAYADPDFPEGEFVQIVNGGNTDLDIAGWKVINATRDDKPTYTFPRFDFKAGNVLVLWSRVGNDNLAIGDFYWDLNEAVWRVGDVAELRDPTNRLIDTFEVSE